MVTGKLKQYRVISGDITNTHVISGNIKIPKGFLPEPYLGATVITPTDTEQVIPTADRHVLKNITINPIPSNYGRISWDGTKLTVE